MNDIYLDPAMAYLAADSMQQRGGAIITTRHKYLDEPDLRWHARRGMSRLLALADFIGSLSLTRRAMELLGVAWSEDASTS